MCACQPSSLYFLELSMAYRQSSVVVRTTRNDCIHAESLVVGLCKQVACGFTSRIRTYRCKSSRLVHIAPFGDRPINPLPMRLYKTLYAMLSAHIEHLLCTEDISASDGAGCYYIQLS